jgi:peptide-methionine (S)-S-oxide reductase
MIFDLNKKVEMPDPKDVLKGRDQSLTISPKHHVNGQEVKGPYPTECKELNVAMGCFWGAEKLFWQQQGVYSTSVGYTDGYTKNPTYQEVCSGNTGHTEAVLVVYDPATLPLKELLRIFWEGHDPTQYMRQGNDIGTQYRSAVFFSDEMTLDVINQTKQQYQKRLIESGRGSIVTEIKPLKEFFFAEDYHQQYLAKNPKGYCGLGGTGVCLEG